MTTGLIGVVNKSTVVKDAEIQPYIDAQVHQLHYQFCPAWRLFTPAVVKYAHEADIPKGGWPVIIFDNSDQQGALAYHSETPAGLPYARVFAKTLKDNNVTWTSGASHEVLEAVADSACNRLATANDGTAWALEVCDPVESTGYLIGAVEVSDFVRPAWFDAEYGGSTCRWHQSGEATLHPFELDPGGYAVTTSDLTNWNQIFGSERAKGDWRHQIKAAGSRTDRRVPILGA